MTEEFGILLIAQPIVYQDKAIPIFNQQAAQCPGAKIIFIGRVDLVSERLGHNAKHGATIKLEITCINGV